MHPARWLFRVLIPMTGLVVMSALVGCDVPAQIVWSPDGSHAAYRSGGNAFLLNQQGTVLQPLGSSVGGFVWSTDSKSLYFAADDADRNSPTPLQMQWLGPAGDSTTQPATESAEPKTVTAVSVLNDGKAKPLFRLADVIVWHLQLSPDGQWLAAMTSINKQDDNSQEFRLFVYSIRGGALYELSRFCGVGACFTRPNELAFVEANGLDAVGQLTGHIVKVKLDGSAATLPRKALLDVIPPLTKWMEPCTGGVIFSAAPRAFPAPPTVDSAAPDYKLFHYSCADGGLSVLADDVGELFDASPDGKRILYERLTPAEVPATSPSTAESSNKPAPAKDELCVMNANGSDPHVLRSLDEYVGDPKPPMWPAWRGNDQITFIAAAEDAKSVKVDDHDRKVLDVIQYRLTDKGALEPLQSLSGDWKAEIKPYFHAENAK
jgi:hypothetical protein